MKSTKLSKQFRRQQKIRSKISGTSLKPRLCIFRSNRHIFAQLIDDIKGETIASASDQNSKSKITKLESATNIGKMIAENAIAKKIENVVFDRRGYRYHGRVKALAESARENGLKF